MLLRVAGIAVTVWLLINAYFVVSEPRTWLGGIALPLTQDAVIHGQGLVDVSLYFTNGSDRLDWYGHASKLLAAGLLALFVLFVRRLGPAATVLPWCAFFLATRSQDGYYLMMTPLWLAAAITAPLPEFMRRVAAAPAPAGGSAPAPGPDRRGRAGRRPGPGERDNGGDGNATAGHARHVRPTRLANANCRVTVDTSGEEHRRPRPRTPLHAHHRPGHDPVLDDHPGPPHTPRPHHGRLRTPAAHREVPPPSRRCPDPTAGLHGDPADVVEHGLGKHPPHSAALTLRQTVVRVKRSMVLTVAVARPRIMPIQFRPRPNSSRSTANSASRVTVSAHGEDDLGVVVDVEEVRTAQVRVQLGVPC